MHCNARVGLDHTKAKVLNDAAQRRALSERLLFGLDGELDPWHEFDRAGVDARKFQPIGVL